MYAPHRIVRWTLPTRLPNILPQKVTSKSRKKLVFVRLSIDKIKWNFGHLFSKSGNTFTVVLLGPRHSINSPFWNLVRMKDSVALSLGQTLIDRSHDAHISSNWKVCVTQSNDAFTHNNTPIYVQFASFT
jgi:hypothetical protein